MKSKVKVTPDMLGTIVETPNDDLDKMAEAKMDQEQKRQAQIKQWLAQQGSGQLQGKPKLLLSAIHECNKPSHALSSRLAYGTRWKCGECGARYFLLKSKATSAGGGYGPYYSWRRLPFRMDVAIASIPMITLFLVGFLSMVNLTGWGDPNGTVAAWLAATFIGGGVAWMTNDTRVQKYDDYNRPRHRTSSYY